jgi:hypothetical protein
MTTARQRASGCPSLLRRVIWAGLDFKSCRKNCRLVSSRSSRAELTQLGADGSRPRNRHASRAQPAQSNVLRCTAKYQGAVVWARQTSRNE